MRTVVAVFLSLCLAEVTARAEDAVPGVGLKPAEKQQQEKERAKKEEGAKGDETIFILGKRMLKESEPVGSYKQPFWTATRRFPGTRVYVLPAGSVHFEYWLRADGLLESGDRAKFRSQYELEFGLGKHFQLDLYLVTRQGKGYAPLEVGQEKIELRWALADWGVIWGNPTLYLEWIRNHEGPQALEGKILLGDSITPRLFWGLNLVYEIALGGEAEAEYAATFGVSHAVLVGVFSVGLEGRVALVDRGGNRFDFVEKEFLAGPSFQVRPLPGIFIDLLPMFGASMNGETEAAYRFFFILGKEF